MFLGIRNHKILYRLSGTYYVSHINPDKTTRTETYYVAPMLPRGLPADRLKEIALRLEVCVWVTSRTQNNYYFHVLPGNSYYLKAVSKALKGQAPSCTPMFLRGYDSPQGAYDRNIRYLEILFGVANAVPLILLIGYGLISRFKKRSRGPGPAQR